jgi:hypothetical protein
MSFALLSSRFSVRVQVLTFATIVLSLAPAAPAAAASSCEDLRALTLPNAEITSAATVATGAFRPPNAQGGNPAAPAGMRSSRRWAMAGGQA